jgi:hypothetical protein
MNQRDANAPMEELQAFMDGGIPSNTKLSRKQWGKVFLNHLKERNTTLEAMAVEKNLIEELIRFYFSVKKLFFTASYYTSS